MQSKVHDCLYSLLWVIDFPSSSPVRRRSVRHAHSRSAPGAGGARRRTLLRHNSKVFSIKRFLRAQNFLHFIFKLRPWIFPSDPTPTTARRSLILRLYSRINIVYIDKVFLPTFSLLFSFPSECLKNCQWRLWTARSGLECSVLPPEGLKRT